MHRLRLGALKVPEPSLAVHESERILGTSPELTLPDLSGVEQSLASRRGRIVVLTQGAGDQLQRFVLGPTGGRRTFLQRDGLAAALLPIDCPTTLIPNLQLPPPVAQQQGAASETNWRSRCPTRGGQNLLMPILVARALRSMLLLCLAGIPAIAQDDFKRFGVELEGGVFGFTRNDVRIPGDNGTRFDLLQLDVGRLEPYARIYGEVNFNPKHGIRLLYAPLRSEGDGTLPELTEFAGETYQPDIPTRGIYEFNTYRITYRYTLLDREEWQVRVGVTALVRDAKIELRQGQVQSFDDDLGVVPLGYFSARYRFTPRAHLLFDFEGLAAPQGRALDGILRLNLDVTDNAYVGIGYRMLEGGVDNDTVFNFSWIHYGALTVGYRF